MRKVISISIEFPDIITETLRSSVGKVLNEVLRTEVYDVWDSYDERVEASAKPVFDLRKITITN